MLAGSRRPKTRPALAGLMVAGLAAAGCGGGAAGDGRSILLITVDTLRADALGSYGAGPEASPRIDALAGSGARFERAAAVAPLTLTAHATMMTGRLPVAHGVRHNVGFVLPEPETTLAEVLRESGYRTGAFVGAFPVASRFGLGQGFEIYDESFTFGSAGASGEAIERRAGEVNAAALPWLERTASSGEPFFLWVHYFDPHHPYEPPEPFAGQHPGEPYAGEVAAVDEAVGALLDALDASGAADRSAVLLVGDHGESLGDHGEDSHGFFVYEPTMHVPFIARVPWIDMPPRTVPDVVSQTDVAPTLLDLAGIEPPGGIQGRSLVPLIRGESLPPAPALGECSAPWLEFRIGPLRTVREGDLKFIDAPRPELYDLAADPDESTNLAGDRPDDVARLRTLIDREVARAKAEASAAAAATMSAEELEKLAALGYLGGTSSTGAGAVPDPEAGMPDPKDFLDVWKGANQASVDASAGQFDSAVATLRTLLTRMPDSPSLRGQLGEALLMSGRHSALRGQELRATDTFREARDVLRKLVAADPDNALARMRLGQASEVLDDKEAALEQYRAAVELPSPLPEARVLLGRLLFRSGFPDEGVAEMRRVVEEVPDNLSYRRDLAGMLENIGQGSEIEEVMLDYTRQRPDDPRSWNELGSVRLQGRDLKGAEEAFRRAARLDRDNATARTNLGGLMIVKGDFSAAEEHYRAAVAAAPELAEARLGLARAVLFGGREEEGRRLLDEFAARHPTDSRAVSYWGLYQLEVRGDRTAARAAFVRALQIDPRDRIALQHLAGGQ